MKTKIQSMGNVKETTIHSVETISSSSVYHTHLANFPSITKLPNPNNRLKLLDQPLKHKTIHYIETIGHPVVAKPRHLAPDRLKIAGVDFQNMIRLGHMRHSRSNYASPLHIVPKKGTMDWRLVEDYRALNAQTIKEKYPIPCISDFTTELHDAKVFSHIDISSNTDLPG
ncbi:transposon Ty3-G Gag-Pol polyprotein [Trichonephila clavata]|uniref:Transposon Ty3-G Gag-Pol polyprotein n=1 Tax=Trichonephila clavata TaxID=2740835 RepID=A0A8X6FGN1_TRICU|nr:transposon Ty3-G Gag-Pol polyprotein [Trichonephila clavata]